MDTLNVDFKLVPPHFHWRNISERAIRTFKKTLSCWTCKERPRFSTPYLGPTSITNDNHPESSEEINNQSKAFSRSKIKRPVWLQQTLLSPIITEVVIHEKLGQCNSWAPQGAQVWYIGPAPKHYRFWTVHVTKQSTELIGDRVIFFHKGKMPTL